ncbi:MAG: DUF2892 domain-containing protein [Phenylobacterium sp.]|nr:DUF2892 domain-containing protein [Phenylobacterium sp.]MBP7817857.1 DUF2892 domain-containing protein [Phenylobacterium sp.]
MTASSGHGGYAVVFKRNLPIWERVARGVAGVLMLACGLLGPGIRGAPVGYIIAAVGLTTVVTAFIGYCPACAVAGRKLK